MPERTIEHRSRDFVSDSFTYGRRFQVPAIVDGFSSEWLASVADTSPSRLRVTRHLSGIMARRGRPKTIVSDKGNDLAANRVKSHGAANDPVLLDRTTVQDPIVLVPRSNGSIGSTTVGVWHLSATSRLQRPKQLKSMPGTSDNDRVAHNDQPPANPRRCSRFDAGHGTLTPLAAVC